MLKGELKLKKKQSSISCTVLMMFLKKMHDEENILHFRSIDNI